MENLIIIFIMWSSYNFFLNNYPSLNDRQFVNYEEKPLTHLSLKKKFFMTGRPTESDRKTMKTPHELPVNSPK